LAVEKQDSSLHIIHVKFPRPWAQERRSPKSADKIARPQFPIAPNWCHPSALLDDRIHAVRGKQIDAAAFDLPPRTNNQAGDKIKHTPIEELKKQRCTKKRNPTRRRIACDAWLSPLSLDKQLQSSHRRTCLLASGSRHYAGEHQQVKN